MTAAELFTESNNRNGMYTEKSCTKTLNGRLMNVNDLPQPSEFNEKREGKGSIECITVRRHNHNPLRGFFLLNSNFKNNQGNSV